MTALEKEFKNLLYWRQVAIENECFADDTKTVIEAKLAVTVPALQTALSNQISTFQSLCDNIDTRVSVLEAEIAASENNDVETALGKEITNLQAEQVHHGLMIVSKQEFKDEVDEEAS